MHDLQRHRQGLVSRYAPRTRTMMMPIAKIARGAVLIGLLLAYTSVGAQDEGTLEDASLTLQVGATAASQFSPLAGVQVWVTPEDPQIALTRVAGASAAAIAVRVAAECRDPEHCTRDWLAMGAQAVASLRTDGAGRAKTPMLAHGRYYLIGRAPYGRGTSWLFWHLPIELRAGTNEVTLDQNNASLMR